MLRSDKTANTVFFRELNEKELLAKANPVVRGKDSEKLWEFSYPTVNGEVTNLAIVDYQRGMSTLHNSADQACRDYTRGYHISAHEYKFDPEVADINTAIMLDMDRLVSKCTGYGNDAETKKKFGDWLKSRGGQDTNFFIQTMAATNHFTDARRQQGMAATDASPIKCNWVVNNEGKLELDYWVWIFSITVNPVGIADNVILTRGTDNQITDISMSGEIPEEYKIRSKNATLLPLMQIKATQQLEIRDGNVVPVMKGLHISGYTRDIRVHPENFLNSTDQRTRLIIDIWEYLLSMIIQFHNKKDKVDVRNKLIALKNAIEKSNFGEKMDIVFDVYRMALEELQCINSQHDNDSLFSLVKDMIFDDEAQLAFIAVTSRLTTIIQTYHPKATRQFKPADSGNIEELTEWCQSLRDANAFPDGALGDIRKHQEIDGKRFTSKTSDDEIKKSVSELTKRANTSCEADKLTLANWILSKGGAINTTVLTSLFAGDKIKIDLPRYMTMASLPQFLSYQPNPTSVRCQPRNIKYGKVEWKLEADGSISLTYALYLTTLSLKENILVIGDQSTNKLVLRKPNELSNDAAPIMRIETKISLQVANGQVTPVVKSLNMESYSPNVKFARTDLDLTHAPLIGRIKH